VAVACARSFSRRCLAVYIRIIIDRSIEAAGSVLSLSAVVNRARKGDHQRSGKDGGRGSSFGDSRNSSIWPREKGGARRLQEGFSLLSYCLLNLIPLCRATRYAYCDLTSARVLASARRPADVNSDSPTGAISFRDLSDVRTVFRTGLPCTLSRGKGDCECTLRTRVRGPGVRLNPYSISPLIPRLLLTGRSDAYTQRVFVIRTLLPPPPRLAGRVIRGGS